MQEKSEDCRKNATKGGDEAAYYAAKWTKPDGIRNN